MLLIVSNLEGNIKVRNVTLKAAKQFAAKLCLSTKPALIKLIFYLFT